MDDDDVDELVTVTVRPSERTAQEVARLLVEHGLGAVVEPLESLEPEPVAADAAGPAATAEAGQAGQATSMPTGFAVRVMTHQAERACDLLGVELPEPALAAAADVKEPAPPWKRILLIWVAAMVIIPVTAGLAAYFLLSR